MMRPVVLGVLLLLVFSACRNDDGDFVPRSNSDVRYEALRSTLVSEIELQSTEQYLTDLPALTNATLVSSNVELLAASATIPPIFALGLSNLVSDLKADGFENFDHAEVWRMGDLRYYFAVFQPVANSRPLMDMRLVILQQDASGALVSVGWLSGPDLVGMVSTHRYLKSQGIANSESWQAIFPSGTLSNSLLSFQNRFEFGFGYNTAWSGFGKVSYQQGDYTYSGIQQNCGIIQFVFTGQVVLGGNSNAFQDVFMDHTWVFPF
ncbi:MAG: hypothetical protein ACFB10_08470 [Salibacteraceae bacterium]